MTGHDVRASFQTKQACTATSESKLQSCWYQTEVLPCFLCHPNCCPTTEKAYFQTKHPHFPLEWDLSETGEVCKCALEPIWKHFHCHSNNERPPHSLPPQTQAVKFHSFFHRSVSKDCQYFILYSSIKQRCLVHIQVPNKQTFQFLGNILILFFSCFFFFCDYITHKELINTTMTQG